MVDTVEIQARTLVKKARQKMIIGFAYNIDQLIDVDKLNDGIVLRTMELLDNHPLIQIDSILPRKWSKK